MKEIRPEYYGGRDDPYEVFKVIRAWELGFFTGNALKYIRRCGEKTTSVEGRIEDLTKAITYLNNEIEAIRNENPSDE